MERSGEAPRGAGKGRWAASLGVLYSCPFPSNPLHCWGEGGKVVWWLGVLSLGVGQIQTQDSTAFYPYALREYAKPQFPSVYSEISCGIIMRTDCKKTPVECVPPCLTQGSIQSMEAGSHLVSPASDPGCLLSMRKRFINDQEHLFPPIVSPRFFFIKVHLFLFYVY